MLVVGGSRGMTGAAHMTAMAALRAGRRHWCTACSRSASPPPSPFVEVITVPVPGERRLGRREPRRPCSEEAARFKAVALGPGLGRAADTQKLVRELCSPKTCRC